MAELMSKSVLRDLNAHGRYWRVLEPRRRSHPYPGEKEAAEGVRALSCAIDARAGVVMVLVGSERG